VTAGFEPERRRFSGHLTLSRLRPQKDVSRLIETVPPFGMTLPVQDVVLYRSVLSRSGARYEVLHRFEMEKEETP
jgi:2'-5' RNA ligase